jgi:hypothetical protein
MPSAGTKSTPNRERSLALSSKSRARLSNGHTFPLTVDGRGAWPRRYRDLLAMHIADLGGADNVSAGEQAILRRAVTLMVSCEQMEERFALDGHAEPWRLQIYQRVSNTLRRLLESIGLQRRQKDVTPDDPLEYARRYREINGSAEDAEIVDEEEGEE